MTAKNVEWLSSALVASRDHNPEVPGSNLFFDTKACLWKLAEGLCIETLIFIYNFNDLRNQTVGVINTNSDIPIRGF